MVVWPAGPKRMGYGSRIEHSVLAQMMGPRGYPGLLQNLRMFLPSTVQYPIRARGWGAFLNKTAPALPRVLLITSKTEVSSSYAALSTVHAWRGVFGLAPASDETLLAAFGSPALPALLVSGPGPHVAPRSDAAGPAAGAHAGWTRFEGKPTYADMSTFLSRALAPVGGSVPLLDGPAALRRLCGPERPDVTMCFLAVLPPEEVGALGEAELPPEDPRPAATLRRLARRSLTRLEWDALAGGRALPASRLALAFGAVDSEAQAAWAANMRAGEGPTLLAINMRKRLATVFRGAFSDAALYEWVLAVMEKATTAPDAPRIAYDAVEPLPEFVVKLELMDPLPELKQQEGKKKKVVKKVKKVVKKDKAAAAAAAGEDRAEL